MTASQTIVARRTQVFETLTEPQPYRVYQRSAANVATMRAGAADPGSGGAVHR